MLGQCQVYIIFLSNILHTTQDRGEGTTFENFYIYARPTYIVRVGTTFDTSNSIQYWKLFKTLYVPYSGLKLYFQWILIMLLHK